MITTRDVQLAPDRIWTPHAVNFRLGASYGSGTELRMHLMPREDGARERHGPSVGGIRTVELAHEVKLYLDVGRSRLVPREGSESSDAANARREERRSPPIEVTCRGPFQFDVLDRMATFNEQVNVLQIHPEGQSDQLLCEILSLHFAGKGRSKSETAMPKSLKLASIEAKGRPVMVRSPSTETDVRCQSLVFDVIENRLRLAGQGGVWLRRESSEVRAAFIDYAAAEDGRLGTLLATGPGRIDAKLGKKRDQPFTAQWQTRLQIQPFKDHKVVSLVGEARSSSSQWGSLIANELHVYLSEIERVGNPKPERRFELRPDAMKAVGQVQIDSPQLVGSTEDLIVWIEHAPRTASPATPEPRQPNAFDRRPDGLAADNANPKDRYKIHGGSIRVQLVSQRRGQTDKFDTKVANVVVEKNAYFAESPPPGSAVNAKTKQPLLVRGQLLHVDEADTPDMRVAVVGTPGHIEARGMSLEGQQIRLDRRSNQLWIDRAGELIVPVERDLDGKALRKAGKLAIKWTGGMTFDGTAMEFREDVSASTAHHALNTEKLTVQLTKRVDFSRTSVRQKVDLRRLDCQGRVQLQSESLDSKGERESWLRATAKNLSIEQASGRLAADGPGWVKIVRRGSVDTSRIGLPSSPNRSTAVSDRLSYLGVDFQRRINGNILPGRRQLAFSDDVKTVFGPVERWADELDTRRRVATRPENVLLSCDKLTVSQSPPRAGTPAAFDLAAEGSTRVEGKGFAAMASRLSYAEAKDLLILDSDGLSDARLYRDDENGGRSEMAARQIHYWPRTQRFRVFGARSMHSVAGRP